MEADLPFSPPDDDPSPFNSNSIRSKCRVFKLHTAADLYTFFVRNIQSHAFIYTYIEVSIFFFGSVYTLKSVGIHVTLTSGGIRLIDQSAFEFIPSERI